jgi:hypothetical protein
MGRRLCILYYIYETDVVYETRIDVYTYYLIYPNESNVPYQVERPARRIDDPHR